ncbi:MAG: decarboxylating NADP(+)-dependent phosphogluconate dehydrogenase [Spirochaetes bacterium]|nr:decarboxylating NADP(+)-dependent phosphogluconate dehydrogenase [Spirochaetota bacterium]
MKADIGLIGLAVMGENLVLNMESKGFTVAVFNRTTSKVDEFLSGRGAGKKIIGTHSLEELAEKLSKPRKVMMMVKAGQAVDDTIAQLLSHLDSGDIVIDGGNSNYEDTMRRAKDLEAKGFLFVGSGVSGGEEGALNGPSLMPGGSTAAWPQIKPIFQAISAKVEDGSLCCDWVGSDGAGHFVKMVHNGIEYGDMQLISEVYQIMRDRLRMSEDEMSQVFAEWDKGDLDSYLVEITRDILKFKDEDGKPLVGRILDTAGQKGTGKWAGIAALNFGVPLTLIGESVFARCLSAAKDDRVLASKTLAGPAVKPFSGDRKTFIADLGAALYAAKVVSYAQGYLLMEEAAKEHGWKLDFGSIALLWRGGCIIRSAFLGRIKEAFDADPSLRNLLLAPFFTKKLAASQTSWRRVIAECALSGIPAPSLYAALSYYDGVRTASLPANLIQAQRDYFGAHTYERTDRPRGEFHHTNWTGHGGSTAASTYNV